jgi:hypothetical protein
MVSEAKRDEIHESTISLRFLRLDVSTLVLTMDF